MMEQTSSTDSEQESSTDAHCALWLRHREPYAFGGHKEFQSLANVRRK